MKSFYAYFIFHLITFIIDKLSSCVYHKHNLNQGLTLYLGSSRFTNENKAHFHILLMFNNKEKSDLKKLFHQYPLRVCQI